MSWFYVRWCFLPDSREEEDEEFLQVEGGERGERSDKDS